MAGSELLLRVRLREVEKELASVKIECQRLTKLEDELKAIRNDFTTIRIEHENIKSDRKDIKDQVHSVERYISECLDIVDTTAKKVQIIGNSLSDLQERDVSGVVGTTSEPATAETRNGAAVPAQLVGFGAAFLQKMDDIKAEVLRKTDETNAAVLEKLDNIDAAIQLKLDRVREEEGHLLTVEATDNTLFHNQALQSRHKIDAEMMLGIAKRMEDVLEHSIAVVSCETKLEKLEKMISQSMSIEAVADIGNRLDAKVDGLEQRIVALSSQSVQEFIDIDQKFNAIMRQGDLHGLDNLIKLISKVGTTMETLDRTLRNNSVSEASLENILQWVQSMGSKLVDLSGKIESQSRRRKGANSNPKAVNGRVTTKADLQCLIASLPNGKDTRKDKPKLISAPTAGPSKPPNVKPSIPTVSDSSKPKLATTLGLSLHPPIAKLATAAPASSPAVLIQEKSVQMEMSSDEMHKIHAAETVEQRAEHLAAYKKRVLEVEAEAEHHRAQDEAKAELHRVQTEAKTRAKAESGEFDVSETDSEDNALLVRFAEIKKSIQASTPTSPVRGLSQGKTGISNRGNAPSTSSRTWSPSSSLNARAAHFKMPGSFSLGSEIPFDDWEDKLQPVVARKERAKSPLKFADSY
ncbi:hypothetical protein E2P81_ATG00500 [Venturia nashicola]|uniref:Uncharacterized protein n=1 Tax=Venturia nashicola TaxID=86259 RepID=A0A4Z1PGL8_9PEZI|nr:hypothetical protein E6O75_ATG00513 [Venturia nashicola]TLD39513.1 hypothetical protein E2P81_ATG00500 [Venturia nashicola]